MEYLLIIGFAALMIIPLFILYEVYTSNSGDEIITSQIYQIEHKIIDAAETIYFLGIPSQTTIKVYIPKQISSASLERREILYNLTTRSGITEIVQVSSVNLTGALPTKPGLYTIRLNASDIGVKINYT